MNIAIIPARGGSRRIPRKNIRPFHGKPIIAYSIETAKAVKRRDGGAYFDKVVVSTEDEEIAEVAAQCGAEVIRRPPELAEIGAPDCGTQEVTRHALLALGVSDGMVCCIYPCAPMLLQEDIAWALQMVWQCEWPKFAGIPGMVYCGRAQSFIDRVSIEPHDSDKGTGMLEVALGGGGKRYIDINTEDDFKRAERMYADLQKEAA